MKFKLLYSGMRGGRTPDLGRRGGEFRFIAGLPVLVLGVMTLPAYGQGYHADFEEPGWRRGSIHGQGGWQVDQGSAEIRAGEGIKGSAGLVLLPASPFSQARLTLNVTAGQTGTGNGVTFISLHVRPVAGGTAGHAEFIDVDSARVALIPEAGPGGAGRLHVFHGDGNGGGHWLATEARIPLEENGERSREWHRLTVRQDTGRQCWDLWLDGVWVAAGLGFQETRSPAAPVCIFMGDRDQPLPLDDLGIGPANPLEEDEDADGMPDARERLMGSDPLRDDRESDADGDGITNLNEWLEQLEVTSPQRETGTVPPVPHLSLPGGLRNTAAELTVSAPRADLTFYYTTDGSDPRSERAEVFTSPIPVKTTMVFRAAARTEAGLWGPAVSRTWIFPEHVSRQEKPDGLPDYFTDLQKNGFGEYRAEMPWTLRTEGFPEWERLAREALETVPVVSLTADPADLFDGEKGIYHRPASLRAEIEATAQVLEGEGAGETLEARMEISGESSRHHSTTLKHSLCLKFDRPSELVPGLGRTGSVLLRHPAQDSWAVDGRWGDLRPSARYYADALAAGVLAGAGHGGMPRRFVHVFLNGSCWGIYEAISRVSPGGAGADSELSAGALLHAGNTGEVEAVFGEDSGWRALIRRARDLAAATRDGAAHSADWDALLAQADLPNLVDYILVNYWLSNQDWPQRNFLITAQGGQFRFLSWDAELIMPHDAAKSSNLTAIFEASDGPAGLFTAFCWAPSFRKLVRERVNGETPAFDDRGILKAAESLQNRLRPLLPLEAARWGAWYEPGKDLPALWEKENQWVRQQWGEGRSARLRAPLLAKLDIIEKVSAAARAVRTAQKGNPAVPEPFAAEVVDGKDMDSDGDGIPDAWEIAQGLDPFNPEDAALDPDGNGRTSLEEFAEQSRPGPGDGEGQPGVPALTGVFKRGTAPALSNGRILNQAVVETTGLLLPGFRQIPGTSAGPGTAVPGEKDQ